MPGPSDAGPTGDVSNQTASMPHTIEPSFEERWAAWQARGLEHDRVVRRKMVIAAPLLAVIAAILYMLLR